MYLKNLTVLGFKSFADKTSLNFQPGVTAIVGPNGCGKSNVSDAIRWVLGEQSAKALRGDEMADVIFNGTDSRKPLSMAEVSLTIGGVDAEHLSAAGVEIAYNEVTLTRRVFRDGASEYFLNKTPCRLKDIQQLFMGTGVGRASYSIMAQGNITQILSSKPEDRRLVFEEAAGITKFKAQKRESLRKLEATEQNLLRVADLIREVKRQIGSLQRQAGKAKRYKQLMLELQHLDTQLARHQFDLWLAELRAREQQLEQSRAQIETLSASVLRVENELAVLREELAEHEQQINQMQQVGLELKSQVERHEHRIQFNEDRRRDLDVQNSRATTEITQADERRLAAQNELGDVEQRLAAATTALKSHQEELEKKRQALQGVENELRANQESLREAQTRAFEAAQQLSRARNELTALDLQKEGNAVRLEKLSAEKVQLEEERTRLTGRLEQFSASVEVEKLNAQSHRGTVEERQARLREIHQQLEATTRELDELLRQQAEKRSRLNVLEQLQAEHEGFGTGALSALKTAANVLGSLSDKIRVPDQYVVAIETALGHHLQLVLTEQPDAARQILDSLRNHQTGRASIAALQLTGQPAQAAESEAAGRVRAAAVGAVGVVEADPSVLPLLQRLLGQTLILPDLATATAAWHECGGAFDFVTPEGDLLNRHGIFTGGYLNGQGSSKGAASILGRKNQIEELRAGMAGLQENVNEISRRKGALLSEQTELQAGLQQAQTELRTQEVAIATRQGEFNALQNSGRVLQQKIETVVYEVNSLAAQEEEGARKRQALAAQAGDLETREREWQTRLTALTASQETLRQQRDLANASLTETKVALATQDQLAASFASQKKPLELRIAELISLVELRRAEIESFLQRKLQAETEMAESRQKIEGLQHEREQVNVQVTERLAHKEAKEEEISSADGGLREQRRVLHELQEQRASVEVEIAQKNMALQNLRERMREKYQVDLDTVRSECITITFADEGPAKVHTLSPEEMAASGAATDWDAVAKQVAALQTRIDEIGPVNLVAIDEYEETEQRFQFLTKQNDDLVQAKAQLIEVINRINTQTRQMFVETFEKIRANFSQLFVEIFGGGKADLLLTQEEGDVLECGIDIVARPPGKQLQSISLLSGGEQTMTAVALLFSIYQVKPSPFCVLDELDAPLDESNINRFIQVLQRFMVYSQFVIITHNKRTIGMADVLYGATMQEHGVSKIVSVKFRKADEQARIETPHPLEEPPAEPSVQTEEDRLRPREDTIVMAK